MQLGVQRPLGHRAPPAPAAGRTAAAPPRRRDRRAPAIDGRPPARLDLQRSPLIPGTRRDVTSDQAASADRAPVPAAAPARPADGVQPAAAARRPGGSPTSGRQQIVDQQPLVQQQQQVGVQIVLAVVRAPAGRRERSRAGPRAPAAHGDRCRRRRPGPPPAPGPPRRCVRPARRRVVVEGQPDRRLGAAQQRGRGPQAHVSRGSRLVQQRPPQRRHRLPGRLQCAPAPRRSSPGCAAPAPRWSRPPAARPASAGTRPGGRTAPAKPGPPPVRRDAGSAAARSGLASSTAAAPSG